MLDRPRLGVSASPGLLPTCGSKEMWRGTYWRCHRPPCSTPLSQSCSGSRRSHRKRRARTFLQPRQSTSGRSSRGRDQSRLAQSTPLVRGHPEEPHLACKWYHLSFLIRYLSMSTHVSKEEDAPRWCLGEWEILLWKTTPETTRVNIKLTQICATKAL